MLLWLWRTHNMLHMFLIPLQLCGIRPTKLDTCTHTYTKIHTCNSLATQGFPNHVPSMGPPVFIKTQTRKGGADRSRVAKKGCWDGVLQPVWLRVWERVWRCVFLERRGCMGIDFGIKQLDWKTPTHSSSPARGPEGLSSTEGPATTTAAICCLGSTKGRSEVK